MIHATFFESHPEGRYEVVVGHGCNVELAKELVGEAGIPVDTECILGDFAITVADLDAMITSQSLIVGETVPLNPVAA